MSDLLSFKSKINFYNLGRRDWTVLLCNQLPLFSKIDLRWHFSTQITYWLDSFVPSLHTNFFLFVKECGGSFFLFLLFSSSRSIIQSLVFIVTFDLCRIFFCSHFEWRIRLARFQTLQRAPSPSIRLSLICLFLPPSKPDAFVVGLRRTGRYISAILISCLHALVFVFASLLDDVSPFVVR